MKKWKNLPEALKTPQVRKYYDILESKKLQLAAKRTFDVVASAGLIAVLSPVMVGMSVAIKLDSPGPVFYRQERFTRYGKTFRIHKFRSMVQDADKGSQVTVSNDARVTKVGRFIRKYKLDEFGQLIDVLKGDMSFVGTRPEVRKYVDAYTDEMNATFLMPAGITSNASICYKDENQLLDSAEDTDRIYIEKILPDKMRYNLRDIENFSLANDIRTMLKTVLAVAGYNMVDRDRPLIAVLTNDDDDIYCFRKELLEAIKQNGFDLLISCPYGEKFTLLEDLKYKYDDPVIDRRGTSVINDSKLMLHYAKLFLKYKPKVVLTYTIKPNIYAGMVCSVLGIPYISNITGLGSALNNGGVIQKISMLLYKIAMNKASTVMFQNSFNADFLVKSGIVKGHNKIIPGSGVNTEMHRFEEYPDEDRPIDFLTVGRIMKDKGTDELLKAAEIIKKKYPEVRFRMIGRFDGNYEDIINDYMSRGIVEYYGQQKDVHPFMKDANAVIHPSYHEGMANVLLEAAATGRPVIASDIPGCRETFDDGITGYSCKVKDADSLVEAIEKFILTPYDKKVEMGRLARQKMEKQFDRKYVVNEYMTEINDIVNRG